MALNGALNLLNARKQNMSKINFFHVNDYKIRYDISNSVNCGGTCAITQTGVATATITVGGLNTYLGLDFTGIGEREQSNFEKIKFTFLHVSIFIF